jgi:hypothetical protein
MERGASALRYRLCVWEAAAYGDPVAAYHRGELARYLAGLRTLTREEPQRGTAALLAALALGPRTAPPGPGELDSLLAVSGRTDVETVELAIAWGCGWGRDVMRGHPWRGRWDAALLALCGLAERSVDRTLRWLGESVPGLAAALRAGGPRDYRNRLVSYAHVIAMELSLGTPAGRPPRHALTSWRPDDCRLPAFVATAVRGSARLPPPTGAFAASMLAELLREDHLVRVDAAEFHVCHACNAALIARSPFHRRIRLSSVLDGLHDLALCPVCGTPPHPAFTYRLARRNWLIVPVDWGGRYEAVRRRRCAGCGNLFSAGHERCPLCLRPAPTGRRLTAIWVRAGP